MVPTGTKSVLITGCSTGGIGHALALTFQRKGCTVFATARDITKMSDLTSLSNTHCLALDVTSKSSIQQAVEFVTAHTNGRGLDILINNSGQQYVRPMMDVVEEEARKMFDVNFWGVFAVTQAFVDMLILAKGAIVNMASISGYWYTPYMAVYNASKAALAIFGETLRLELQPFGVRVISVITGAVDTNIMKNSSVPKLPTTSCYYAAEKQIIDLALGNDNDGVKRMSAEEFAGKVAGDVIGGANGKIWRGGYSSIARLFNVLMPTGVLDGILSKGRGLDAL
ncbi:NADPH-dependent 1-acyldihydroxyacetone phosphate reductase [Talaromyces pinophilus]|nr:NADPH-dependent 1-acyldihydroxyacetone phosphate reductase [Talaromyces pinophilus]